MWYFNDGGVPEGPVEELVLRRRVLSGQLSVDTLVWREGMEDWKTLDAALPNLDLPTQAVPAAPAPTAPTRQTLASGTVAAAAQAGSAPLAPVSMHSPYATPQTQAPQGAGYYQPPTPTLGLATASMVLGIIGVVLCLMLCFIGLLSSIPAIITGHLAMKKLRNAQSPMQGHGQAKAGLWMGYIVTGLSVLIVMFIIGMVAYEGIQ